MQNQRRCRSQLQTVRPAVPQMPHLLWGCRAPACVQHDEQMISNGLCMVCTWLPRWIMNRSSVMPCFVPCRPPELAQACLFPCTETKKTLYHGISTSVHASERTCNPFVLLKSMAWFENDSVFTFEPRPKPATTSPLI
eukprot:1138845-Pelagomonas_calceolata.AAC.4